MLKDKTRTKKLEKALKLNVARRKKNNDAENISDSRSPKNSRNLTRKTDLNNAYIN